jgi:NAD(P)-dependent dehydrogenase (short-subunit alcohol dehydrogenase family)
MSTYLVTGGTTGIGAATRAQLVKLGHQVINLDIRGGDYHIDFSDIEASTATLMRISSEIGEIDGIVTCAGVASHFPDKEKILNINFWGTVNVVTTLREQLRNGARVVAISSNSAPQCAHPKLVDTLLEFDRTRAHSLAASLTGHDCYAGSKQAVARWVRQQAPDYARAGIGINAIAPGYIETPMTQAVSQSEEYGEAIKTFVSSIPMGRAGQPEDIAALVTFLLSPAAAFIAGALIYADGAHDAAFRPQAEP